MLHGLRTTKRRDILIPSNELTNIMPICGVVGCANRPGVTKNVRFHKTPKVLCNQGVDARNLSEKRRRLWKAAINRSDITTEERWDRTLVCSKHFVDG